MFSEYTKQCILYHYQRGRRPPQIQRILADSEGIATSRSGVAEFIHRCNATGTTARRAGSGRSSVITEEVKEIVEDAMRRDDETSASQLHVLLVQRGYTLSLRSILRYRTQLGWTYRSSAYCQLIREANKKRRLE